VSTVALDPSDAAAQGMAELAALAWKLSEAFAHELTLAPPERAQAGEAMLRFARRKLDTLLAAQDMRLVSYVGEAWTPQVPANPLNLAEIAEGDIAVETTIEPTIICGTQVILPGKILLRNV
jgi:hypothetical protein